MKLSDEDKILIKKSLYLKGVHRAKRLTDEFLEKSWTKRGVNKLFKNLRDTGVTDVSRTITFPDKTFPGRLCVLTGRLFRVQDVSQTITFPDRRFPDNLYK